MKTELRPRPHTELPGAVSCELHFDGKMIALLTGADGPGVRIITEERKTYAARGPMVSEVIISPAGDDDIRVTKAQPLLADMNEPQLRAHISEVAKVLELVLPRPNPPLEVCPFVLLFSADAGPGIAQYVANCERPSMVKMLREAADRLEQREDVTR